MWLVLAVVVFVMMLAWGLRKTRSRAAPYWRTRRFAPSRPPARRTRAPRQWHPLRATGQGDYWALGASAALLAERERLRTADRLVVDDPGCDRDDIGGSHSFDDGARHHGSTAYDDFTPGGGSSGGGGARGDWSDSSSSNGGDSGSDSSDGGSD